MSAPENPEIGLPRALRRNPDDHYSPPQKDDTKRLAALAEILEPRLKRIVDLVLELSVHEAVTMAEQITAVEIKQPAPDKDTALHLMLKLNAWALAQREK